MAQPPKYYSEIIGIRHQLGLDTSATLLNMLSHSIQNGNIHIFTFANSRPIGYVAWISLNKEAFRMALKTHALPPYMHEWNEGHLTLIYDVCFLNNWGSVAKQQLIALMRKKHFFAYFKRRRIGAFYRQKGKLKRCH
ncbi:MAG: hypothetical protein U1F46_11050 [Marinagarivorans sp.]